MTEPDVRKHEWKPIDGERGMYRCDVCGDVKLRRFGRWSRRWNKETPCRGAVTAESAVIETPKPVAQTPSIPQLRAEGPVDELTAVKARRPVAPVVGPIAITPRVFYELFLIWLSWRVVELHGRAHGTPRGFANLLRLLGLITTKQFNAFHTTRTLQWEFLKSMDRLVSAREPEFERLSIANADKLLVLRLTSSSDYPDREAMLLAGWFYITRKGFDYATALYQKKYTTLFPKDPIRDFYKRHKEWSVIFNDMLRARGKAFRENLTARARDDTTETPRRRGRPRTT